MVKFDYRELDKYALTNELFLKFTSNNDIHTREENKKITKKINHQNNRYITPKQKDKLFWCFYILYKSKEDYDLIDDKHFSIEKEFKINFVNIVRENKHLLKKYKLKRNEVEDILINEKTIDIKVFFMFCIYYEIDVIFINKNFYYEIEESFGNSITNIITFINGDYCIDTQKENLDFYRNNYCKMDGISKYIKAVSSYKSEELQDICLKLDINILNDNDKRKTKQELYNDILLLLA